MSNIIPLAPDLDRRLRRELGRLDVSPEFGPRLAARIAQVHGAEGEEARRALRARIDREYTNAERVLRQRFWESLAVMIGVGAFIALAIWLFGPGTIRALPASTQLVNVVSIVSGALLAGWLWVAIRDVGHGTGVRPSLG
jgi:hypothetical protein